MGSICVIFTKENAQLCLFLELTAEENTYMEEKQVIYCVHLCKMA